MGRHSIDKICVANWVDRELAQKLRVLAKQRGFATLADLIVSNWMSDTKKVELTAHDYQVIADEVRLAELRRDRRTKATKARVALASA